MPRREPLAPRQARSRKVQELQPPSLQDATKNGGPHEKVERHIRFDLSRNQFFFLPSKTQLKKQALVAQAQNVKPSLLLTALNTRSVLKKHTQLEKQNTSDKVTLIPPDDSQDKCCTPKLVVAENADSDIRIPKSSRNELEKTQVDDNGLQRAVPKDGNSHVDTAENEKSTSLRDTPITTLPESTNTIPSKPDPTEKGITPICFPNDAETIHDVSSLELLSLLKYPANSFSVERFSRKRSQKSAQNSRYGKHNFAPIRSVV